MPSPSRSAAVVPVIDPGGGGGGGGAATSSSALVQALSASPPAIASTIIIFRMASSYSCQGPPLGGPMPVSPPLPPGKGRKSYNRDRRCPFCDDMLNGRQK